MHSITKAAIAAFACALALAGGVRADDCTEAPVEDGHSVGDHGTDLSNECNTKWRNGTVVNGIQVWATKDHIKGFQLWYSDKTKGPVVGSEEGHIDYNSQLNWDGNEPVQALRLAPNANRDGLGYIQIRDGQGNEMESRSDKLKDDWLIDLEIGSGILLATQSKTNNGFIRELTPLFLGVTQGNAQVVDLEFDQTLEEMNANKTTITPEISEVWLENANSFGGGNASTGWVFKGSKTFTKSSSLSTTKQHTFGTETTVKIGGGVQVPFLAEAKFEVATSVKYEFMRNTIDTTENAEASLVEWMMQSQVNSDLIPPGHAKHCSAIVYVSTYVGDYTSTIQVNIDSQEFFLKQRGTITSNSYTQAFTKCETIRVSEIPAGSDVMDARSTLSDGDEDLLSGSENENGNEKRAENDKRAVKFFS